LVLITKMCLLADDSGVIPKRKEKKNSTKHTCFSFHHRWRLGPDLYALVSIPFFLSLFAAFLCMSVDRRTCALPALDVGCPKKRKLSQHALQFNTPHPPSQVGVKASQGCDRAWLLCHCTVRDLMTGRIDVWSFSQNRPARWS